MMQKNVVDDDNAYRYHLHTRYYYNDDDDDDDDDDALNNYLSTRIIMFIMILSVIEHLFWWPAREITLKLLSY